MAKIRTDLICSESRVHWPHYCRWTLSPMFIRSRISRSESHNIRTSSVPSVKRTLSWIGHSRSFNYPYWCRQESRTVCCRNVQVMPTLFLKLTKIWQRENGKFVDFNDLTQVWRCSCKKRLRMCTNDLYCKKLDYWPTFLPLIVWVYILISFHAINLKVEPPLSLKLLVWNQVSHEIATQGHSRSSALQFAINYRPTRGGISPYNIAVLISEASEEVAT